ncbi:MAG TPA: hypothetical protein VG294_16715 [Solirubrobacteraceae bacterium]|nr:hypothetical protein [Solirubrobacteraceae bacterium]
MIALLVLAGGSVAMASISGTTARRGLPSHVRLQQIDGGRHYFARFSSASRRAVTRASGHTAPADMSTFDSSRFYPISVYDQTLGCTTSCGEGSSWDPRLLTAYRNEGINGFISLYNGYNRSMMRGIQTYGMWAIDWPVAPSYPNPLRGYVWFDEPDGGAIACQTIPPPGALGETVACGPDSSGNVPASTIARVTQDLHSARGAGDPTRVVYGNYTGGHVAANAGMSRSDAGAYVNAVDVASYDDYIIEGAYEPDHNLWRQYDDMVSVRREARYSHPIWCYIEAGDPETHSQWSGITVTPAMETAEAWNAVIGGARGITWFDHDFGGSDSGYANSSSDLVDPNPAFAGLQTAIRSWDREIERLAPILNVPFATGYVSRTSVTGSGNSMNEMAKYDARSNRFYIFAAPRFNSTQTATYTVAGGYSGPVTVYGEHRTVMAAKGVFSDGVSGQTAVHVYVVPNAGHSAPY